MQEQIVFDYTLLPLQKAQIFEDVYFSGKITTVTLHFPGGCEHYVDVAFGHGKVSLCPRDGYIALDDSTSTWYFAEPYDSKEALWTLAYNGDGGNSHYISCIIQVESDK